nr:hypothetical protein BaRGS_030164 [Batillaria attramentaria]
MTMEVFSVKSVNCILVVVFMMVTVASSQSALPSTRPVVHTAQGDVSGIYATWQNGLKYQAFRGIPYAKPPVGDLRFAKPQPPQPFSGVHDASKYGSMCLQVALGPVHPMSEDCLFLNVFAPFTPRNSLSSSSASEGRNETYTAGPYPVLVFIHGGGFVSGSSNDYEPGKLVTEADIIVVTLNYRLGVFGFLSTGDSTLPGNYGLWDQHMALKWVKDNIADFGGSRLVERERVPLLDYQGVLDTEGDPAFYVPLTEFARAVAKGRKTDKRNLVYHFDYYPKFMTTGPHSTLPVINIPALTRPGNYGTCGAGRVIIHIGMSHGMDIVFEYDMPHELIAGMGGDASLWNDEDTAMADKFRNVIMEFVTSSLG